MSTGEVHTSGSTLFHNYYFTDTGGTNDATTVAWSAADNWRMSTKHAEANVSVARGDKYKDGVDIDLFFRFLKTKFTPIETKLFKERMAQLEKMADEFEDLGQIAAQDECIRQFLILMREAAIYACGYELFLTAEQIKKLENMRVKGGNFMKVTNIKNFARILPKNVAEITKACMEKNLFDEYVICHVDDKKSVMDTEDEKIEKKKAKDRDPVMFGRIEHSSKYYFIIDWIDGEDTLQLKDMVKALSIKKTEMKMPKKIKTLDFEEISRVEGKKKSHQTRR